MAGPRQHFIPASIIGGFSQSTTGRLRDRPVWVLRRGSPRPYVAKASKVAYRVDIYTLKERRLGFEGSVDDLWTATEVQLPSGIRRLEALQYCPIPADLWLHCLIPYVTDLFVRGDVFKHRFESQPLVRDLKGSPWMSADNTNLARLMARQRLYYAVIDARWWILRNHSSVPFIINDIGMTAAVTPNGQPGYAIPLTPWLGLMLACGPAHNRLVWDGHRWQAEGIGEHCVTIDDHVQLFNTSMLGCALKECYSDLERPLLEANANDGRNISVDPASALGPAFLIHSEQWLREHEMAYFHYLSLISRPPDMPQ